MGKPGILPSGQNASQQARRPAGPTRKMRVLHNTLTQHLVLSGEQILHKIVTAFIRVARGESENRELGCLLSRLR